MPVNVDHDVKSYVPFKKHDVYPEFTNLFLSWSCCLHRALIWG